MSNMGLLIPLFTHTALANWSEPCLRCMRCEIGQDWTGQCFKCCHGEKYCFIHLPAHPLTYQGSSNGDDIGLSLGRDNAGCLFVRQEEVSPTLVPA